MLQVERVSGTCTCCTCTHDGCRYRLEVGLPKGFSTDAAVGGSLRLVYRASGRQADLFRRVDASTDCAAPVNGAPSGLENIGTCAPSRSQASTLKLKLPHYCIRCTTIPHTPGCLAALLRGML